MISDFNKLVQAMQPGKYDPDKVDFSAAVNKKLETNLGKIREAFSKQESYQLEINGHVFKVSPEDILT